MNLAKYSQDQKVLEYKL